MGAAFGTPDAAVTVAGLLGEGDVDGFAGDEDISGMGGEDDINGLGAFPESIEYAGG